MRGNLLKRKDSKRNRFRTTNNTCKIRNILIWRIPKSYKNRELVPLAPNLNRENVNNNRKSKTIDYKQKYLIEKIVRNEGLERQKLRDQRKLNRFKRFK
jgi:hypothetical protein